MITFDRLNEIAAEVTVGYTSDLPAIGTAPALIEHIAHSLWAEREAESAFGNSPDPC